jgi:hypothetical protein
MLYLSMNYQTVLKRRANSGVATRIDHFGKGIAKVSDPRGIVARIIDTGTERASGIGTRGTNGNAVGHGAIQLQRAIDGSIRGIHKAGHVNGERHVGIEHKAAASRHGRHAPEKLIGELTHRGLRRRGIVLQFGHQTVLDATIDEQRLVKVIVQPDRIGTPTGLTGKARVLRNGASTVQEKRTQSE